MTRGSIEIQQPPSSKTTNGLPDQGDFYRKCDDDSPEVSSTNKDASKEKAESVSYFSLYRYSTIGERLLMMFGVVLAALGSIGVPYSVVIYGEFTSLLIDRTTGFGTSSPTFILNIFGGGKVLTNASKEENIQAIKDDSLAFGIGSVVGGMAEWILLAIALDIMNGVALNQIRRIRTLFLQSILRQDMSWYDTTSGNNFASKMTEDLEKLKEGIAEKVAIFTFLIMTFITSIGASFLYGWELTLVVITCCPFIIISTALVAKIQSSLTVKELKAYSIAGNVAEEVFSGIRTVLAFSGERKESARYNKLLHPAENIGKKKGLYSGIGGGVMWFIIYCSYAIAMWYGVQLIIEDRYKEVRNYTPAVLIIVLFGVIMGAQNLGFSSPHLEAFAIAKGAARSIFAVIDRQTAIDPMGEEGLRPDSISGDIEFENLHFKYPSRPEVQVLKGLSVSIKTGQTVAFVGPSGCGKSTSLQLLQRMYDPESGVVRLDGRNIKDLNVAWLRSQIGVVGQEPVLFATTIEDNIRFGKPTVTQEEIEQACKMANCHNFISQLPDGYKTMVGEKGAQMSGGQKQRIAIARALVRNPRILLLDEATSALDPTSERRVQDALEVASKGRTTLVVSHRLSTVTNADKIVFVKDGFVMEQGTHEELMAKKGLYFGLVNSTKRKEEVIQDQEPRLRKMASFKNKSDGSIVDEDSESEDEDSPEKKELKEKYKVGFFKLMKLNAPEKFFILAGCIAAALHGGTFTVWAVYFGDFFGIMSNPDDDYVQSQANQFALFFLGIGLVAGLGTLVQTYMFTVAGAKLTTRLRQRAFKTIVSQEIGYFDDQRNSVGALCSRLAGDCSNVQGATGSRVGIMVQSVSTLLLGIIMSFVYSWNLTLVTLVTVPFVIGSIMIEGRYMEASSNIERQAVEKASQVAVEAIANIRTINSLGQEKEVLKRYVTQTDQADKASKKKIRFRGTVFGLGQASPFIAYGISLYYGGMLVAAGSIEYENIIKVSEALLFGSWMLGQALAYAPNVGAAMTSAGRLLRLFDRVPAIHNPAEQPFNTVEKTDGDICYKKVEFYYPTRKEIPVLQGLDLTIKKGTTVALVGPSGCGKSTCIQLLLRYYDPISGTVNLSNTPTTEFPLDTLRSQLGLVSQEPVLFDRTIAENIAYGNNFREDIPMSEIIESAKKSNIHDFIVALPQGYETSLGNKGAQLSGGQKQRIAIARALVRDPKILVLDEATSALDMHSEKVVQDALDAARSGRTCITIAHRLTTIRDADMICVLQKGVVVEKGTHDELMRVNGIYAELYRMQLVA
ncbi:multidrug resistance protein homolog 49 [Episyrphus balteatus]|uniref:multidrug resistance protein homolog 49 n=1 Tax=Episyrphus balteatus TaxID=286459 RepID=UPI0024850E8B|nr:multidrug resistance protein homolog 49 [Episyrphus balteatus]